MSNRLVSEIISKSSQSMHEKIKSQRRVYCACVKAYMVRRAIRMIILRACFDSTSYSHYIIEWMILTKQNKS